MDAAAPNRSRGPRRAAPALLLLLLGAAVAAGASQPPAPAQQPQAQQPQAPPQQPQPPRHLSLDSSFALVLPPSWRQLTPDEARALARQPDSPFPSDLTSPRPAPYYPYGDVDRWLAGDFDGRCLTLARVEGEPPMDAEGLAAVRADRAGGEPAAGGGWSREVLSAQLVEIGIHQHPAIECLTAVVPGAGARPCQALELFVPTGGDTLILTLRAFADDFARALPTFRAMVASLSFARPPRGAQGLGSQLAYPAVVGALVGVVLLLLHKNRRARA